MGPVGKWKLARAKGAEERNAAVVKGKQGLGKGMKTALPLLSMLEACAELDAVNIIFWMPFVTSRSYDACLEQ